MQAQWPIWDPRKDRQCGRLNLPEGTLVHPVLHVSFELGHIGKGQMVLSTLPIDERDGKIRALPEAILGRRMVKRNNIPAQEILVQWAQLGEEEAPWEDYDEIRQKSPGISLEDQRLGGDFRNRGRRLKKAAGWVFVVKAQGCSEIEMHVSSPKKESVNPGEGNHRIDDVMTQESKKKSRYINCCTHII